MKISRIVAAAALFYPGFEAVAAEINVAAGDSFSLISAVSNAAEGDVVLVPPGVYALTDDTGTLLVTNGVTVKSTGSWRDTFIEPAEGARLTRLVDIDHADAVVKGFTLRNIVSATNVAGIACSIREAGGLFCDSRVTGCNAASGGSIVSAQYQSKIRRCRFDRNAASAIVSVPAGNKPRNTGFILSNCLICDNDAEPWHWYNSAWLDMVIIHCTVIDNNRGRYLQDPLREAKYINSVLQPAMTEPSSRMKPFVPNQMQARSGTVISRCFYSGAEPNFQNVTMTENVRGDPMKQFIDATANDYRVAPGSVLIAAARPHADYSEETDIDGRVRDAERPTIGCFEYGSSDARLSEPVYLSPGADLAAAVAAAPRGAEIVLSEGSYTLSETVVLDRPVMVRGAGIDKTVITGAESGGFDLFEFRHFRAVLRDVTVGGAVYSTQTAAGSAIRLVSGGWVDRCRVTGCKVPADSTSAVKGFAVAVLAGAVTRSRIDANHALNNRDSFVVYISSMNPSYWLNKGIVSDSFITGNSVGASSPRGAAVALTRESYNDGGCFFGSTVIGNDTGSAVYRTEWGGCVKNCIFSASGEPTSKAWSQGDGSVFKTDGVVDPAKWLACTGTASKVWINNCTYVPVGTNCVSGVAPGIVSVRRAVLGSSSPCIGKGAVSIEELWRTDYAGNPRITKKVRCDIGACQYVPRGMTVVVR